MNDLADKLYIDEDELNEIKTPIVAFEVAPNLVFPEFSKTLFTTEEYPVQVGQIDKSYVGEVQGTYGNRWKPSSSVFGFVRKFENGKSKFHSGIDIYAPKGTPIIAISDGVLIKKEQVHQESIGNRAWLKFIVNGQEWRIIYGHLDSFEGQPGSVNKGDVIGYSGCSGNSSLVGCGKRNKCGLRPDHVHLMLMSPNGNPEDPQAVLKWNLRYLNPAVDDVDCTQIMRNTPV